jgi:hypothetical protein
MAHHDAIEGILTALHERTKELNCLYAVEELVSHEELPLEDILRTVVQTIPTGWQYSEVCRARITYAGQVYASPNFAESPWAQRAAICVQGKSVGLVEVFYGERLPDAEAGPFLHSEHRLIEFIAERLASCITHRHLLKGMRDWRSARQQVSEHSAGDWSAILDLLRRTDHNLLLRITRKMINHLACRGVADADLVLQKIGGGRQAELAELLSDPNEPRGPEGRPDDQAWSSETLAGEAFQIAAAHLDDEEIVACIHQWIRQDRASFLVNAIEDPHTSLTRVADAMRRYHHACQGEIELSPSTLKGLHVSLIHRFLTGQLEFINVAKSYVEIEDFHKLTQRLIYPGEGHGKIGGKAAGLFLARQIVRRHGAALGLQDIRFPRSWYITSDSLYDFIQTNHLEDVMTHKYKELDDIHREYPHVVQVFKHSHFAPDVVRGLSLALDDFGERPLIVRSSSLLEDRFGAAFAGKYKSLFLANQGTKAERLAALLDAIGEVYASVFGPDPILYRAERNLLDFSEGMAILIQEVVGTKIGQYFAPAFAGVAFSHNEFRWSPRIKREDGLVRLVPGLGTRAVDRLGDDYPVLAAPGQPGLRVNPTPEETVRYAPRYLDVINLRTKRFETVEIPAFLRACGADVPNIEQLVSVFEDGNLRSPLRGQLDFERQDLVLTFEGLLARTPFLKQMRALLTLLEQKIGAPVDIELASDGVNLYLLQCRVQSSTPHSAPATIPHDLPPERVVFSAGRHVSNGRVPDVTHIVYVDPDKYSELNSLDQLVAIGRAVGRLNKLLPKRRFILMGPGRWGSRGDIKLGVRVTYADINNTAMLIEIARKRGDYTPDLSFGTHFFQDLVESAIHYLPLYPDEEGVLFNEPFLTQTPNRLAALAPEYANLADTLRVIDVPQAAEGRVLHVLMNAELDQAVGMLALPR